MIALLKQAVPELETAHCDKAARAPAGTMYAKERPRNAIVRWRAKSEGKLNPKKSSKAPVARVNQPTNRKPTTFGAEQGNPKKQKSIVQMNIHTSKSDDSDDNDDDDDASIPVATYGDWLRAPVSTRGRGRACLRGAARQRVVAYGASHTRAPRLTLTRACRARHPHAQQTCVSGGEVQRTKSLATMATMATPS